MKVIFQYEKVENRDGGLVNEQNSTKILLGIEVISGRDIKSN